MKKFKSATVFFCFVFLILNSTGVNAAEIGIAWVGHSGMANRVLSGFQKGIQEMAPALGIEYRKELESIEAMATIAGQWETSKQGMVLLRSSAAKWLGQNSPSIPTFIGGCNHPVYLGALKNMEAPEGNVTGVTYYLPMKNQFQIYKAILPNLQSVLLLLEEGHPGSIVDRDETKKICTLMGITYNEKSCSTVEDAVDAVKSYLGKVSAVIFGNQALLLDNAKQIIQNGGKTPFLSYSERPVKAGALGGFVADDFKLGYMLAKSVAEVVMNNKPVREVPVKMDPNPKFYINVKTAEAIGVEIPFEILETAEIIGKE